MAINTDAAELLRAHGINAFAQGEHIVIYSQSFGRWNEVARFPVPEDHSSSVDHVVHTIVSQLTALVKGPHTHELVPVAV